MMVLLLTEEQKDLLVGQIFADDSYFNPIQDKDYNWVISTEERDFCVNPEFFWIRDLPLIEFIPQDIFIFY
jgi:hypothetical protein